MLEKQEMVLAENRERILSRENVSINFLIENGELWKEVRWGEF